MEKEKLVVIFWSDNGDSKSMICKLDDLGEELEALSSDEEIIDFRLVSVFHLGESIKVDEYEEEQRRVIKRYRIFA